MIQTIALVLAQVAAAPGGGSGSPGQGSDWGRSWGSLRRAARSVVAVTATFEQRKHMRILRRPLVSRGRFAYSSSGAITWEYTSPVRTRLVLSGGRAVRYLWRGGRCVADSNRSAGAMSVVLSEIQLWMRGQFQKSKAFRARLVSGAPSRIFLVPLSRAISRFIKGIELVLAKQKGAIAKVIISEPGGASTRILLRSTKVTYR